MRLNFNSESSSLLQLIRTELRPDETLYLVGGAVRDMLLGRKLNDFDFVMPGDPTSFAKRLAKRLGAGFFVLDDQRHTARVVYHLAEGDFFPLDFVQFTGEDLVADLMNRDFTINAMAVSMNDLTTIIDPLHGQDDLESGQIRLCTDRSLLDDPVRVLRGIRLAMQFGFGFTDGLLPMMQEGARHLPQTSLERQRDEFFRILKGKFPSAGMQFCRQFGVFETLIPPLVAQESIPASSPHVLPLFDHTLRVIEYYHLILECLQPDSTGIPNHPWWLSQVLSGLGQFSSEITAFFEESITPGRSKLGLALLGALLHDVGKPMMMELGEDGRLHYYQHARTGADLAWEATSRMRLSNAESDWVKTLVRNHMRLLPMVNSDAPPTSRSIFRFYKEVGEVGIAIALHALADTAATYEQNLTQTKWTNAVTVVKSLMSAWWEHKDTMVSPALFLDGNDLQADFGLVPGAQIGSLLNDLAEAQVSGDVQTEDDARSFVWGRLSDRDSQGSQQ